MRVEDQIERFLAGLDGEKGDEMRILHGLALKVGAGCRLWYLDGTDESGKVVTNPSIGFGECEMAGGREFYRLGLSANTSGISIYVMGLADKGLLAREFGGRIGKAKVTGYCVRFRRLADVDLVVVEEMFGFALGLP